MAEQRAPRDGTTVPLAEEAASISKREVVTGEVRVSLSTEVEHVPVRETLRGRRVEVERVAVGRALEEGEPAPAAREEGDTLVVPVVEETLVLVKRLVVREEVRLRFLPIETSFAQDVALRRQRATIERVPASEPEQDPTPTPRGTGRS